MLVTNCMYTYTLLSNLFPTHTLHYTGNPTGCLLRLWWAPRTSTCSYRNDKVGRLSQYYTRQGYQIRWL